MNDKMFYPQMRENQNQFNSPNYIYRDKVLPNMLGKLTLWIVNRWLKVNWLIKMLFITLLAFLFGIFLQQHIVFDSQTFFWVSSTIIQALAALIALIGMFYTYKLQEINLLKKPVEDNNLKFQKRKKELEDVLENYSTDPGLDNSTLSQWISDHYLKEKLNAVKKLWEAENKLKEINSIKRKTKQSLLHSAEIVGVVMLLSFFYLPFGDIVELKSSFAQQLANSMYVPSLLMTNVFLGIYAMLSIFATLVLYVRE